MSQFCQSCGTALTPNVTYCPQCGTPAQKAAPPPPIPSFTPPDATIGGPATRKPAERRPDLSAFDAKPTDMGNRGGVPTFASAVGAVGYDDDPDWAERQKADKNATYSLGLGFGSLLCGFFMGIPALILGFMAIPKASTAGRVRAVIGIVLGVSSLCLAGLALLLPLLEDSGL